MAFATISPSTGETLRLFEEISQQELEERLERARRAARVIRSTSFEQRSAWALSAADILVAEVEDVSRIMTTEMGKTIRSARAEVMKSTKLFRYYSHTAKVFLADVAASPEAVGAERAFVRYQPLGVVFAVMPWNFPLWQAVRFAAPALMAGNTGLLKHASNVPQTALYLADLLGRAGFPEDGFQTLLIGSSRVENIVRDRRVAAVTLTGSEAAGAAVAAVAGSVIKPTLLELGGSDPFIVMPSTDMERAAEVATASRCQNNGQSCIAAKRFIVHEEVADEFQRLFVKKMQALVIGDPLCETTDVGPLATEQGREEVEELVADAVAKGAKALCGGVRCPGQGWYYPPTILSEIEPTMRVYSEEVFGPVATLYRVAGIDQAIEVANGTQFGLGANVWTDDEDQQRRFVEELESGAVFVNGMVTSYPELPFGGVKASGYGRELSAEGIRVFCNAKTVWIGAK